MHDDATRRAAGLLPSAEVLASLTTEETAALLRQAAQLESQLTSRLAARPAVSESNASSARPLNLLMPAQAAERLGVSVRWLYRHSKKLPFAVRLSRKVLRFSEEGIRSYVAKKGLASRGTL